MRDIQFCGDKLVVSDSKNDINVFSLDTRNMVASYSPPGRVTAVLTDPTLDYCLIGLQNGGYENAADGQSEATLTLQNR